MLRHPYTISAAAFCGTVALGALGLFLAVAIPVSMPPGLLPEPGAQMAEAPSQQVRVILESPYVR